MARTVKRVDKGIKVKSIDYPVIYSYIYERESEDIKRLADKFKHARIKKPTGKVEVKTIIAFRIDENGKLIPVYETPNTGAKEVRKISQTKNIKTAQIKKATTRTSVAKPKSAED